MKTANGIIERIASEQSRLSGKRFNIAVKNKITFLLRLRRLIKNDLREKTHLSLKHSLRAWRHGFMRFHYKTYGLDKSGDPAQYVSDFTFMMNHYKINGRFDELVRNKYAFGLLMNLQGIPTPKIKGLIIKGTFYPLDEARTLPASEFLQAEIIPGEHLALKPIWGNHGFGFINLARDDAGYRLNNESVSRSLICGMVERLDHYIVTEFMHQGEFCRRLFADTSNTIRLVTLWDAETSEAFIARAVMRIGTSRSFPVDNFKAGHGGLSAMIDPDTGELGPGATVDATGKSLWYRHHPESHSPIQGVVVPAWDEVRTRLLEYAGRFAFVPNIGWDILLLDKGFSILEGNSTPGMQVLQIHGPLLTDPRIKRFYQNFHGQRF
ncbi:MAG: hypothetical protein E4H23_09315 [Chrysiogenales bacterium]|nr:MAG: hypothetical protein E4H23_09315 [Chrysiogenales bacterium]